MNDSYADPWVDHVARVVYDYGYEGAGNWAFNTAYAAILTGNAFVTRLASLREAERFIRAGIPLAASISFGRGQLSGAPISSTAGHLVVIVRLHPRRQGRRQRPGRPEQPLGPAHLRPRPVRAGLADQVGGHRLRRPRRGASAPGAGRQLGW